MHGTLPKLRAEARQIVRPIGRVDDQTVGDVLSDIASVLWTTNTAPCLADEIGKLRGKPCPVRTAERYLGGQRDWSSDAVAAIVGEIMRRHGMRNAKTLPRK